MIRFFRSIIVCICFFIFGAGSFVLGFILFPCIHIFVKKCERSEYFSSIIRSSWKFFTNLLINTRVINLNVDKEAFQKIKGKIVVANHPTFIDIVLLIGLLPKSICLAKKDVLKNPFFRNIVSAIYIVNDIDIEKFKENSDKFLKQNYNIVIFPTGTRNKPNENVKIHKGSATIAINSKVDIVPIKIFCDSKFLTKGQPFYDGTDKVVNYELKILDKISIKDFDENDEIKLRNKISQKIKDTLF